MNCSRLPMVTLLALTSRLAFAAPNPAAATPDDGPPRPASFEPAPRDTIRDPFPSDARGLVRDLDAWFAMNPHQRLHVQLDRPLYKPGDTISFKAWDLKARGLSEATAGMTVQLLDPRGTAVQSTYLRPSVTNAAFKLAPAATGGAWKVRLTASDGTHVDQDFVVDTFQAPRIEKTLEFARDSYSPSDTVEAAVTLRRNTGEKLANHPITALVQANGTALDPVKTTTDDDGDALVRFTLPASLSTSDVLLTVLVEDGGVTESISRAVPVVLHRVQVSFYPEGGDLVTGLPDRVYFEATDPNGEAAHVRGAVLDDRGRTVATFGSWVDGRGRFAFTPEPGRTYRAHLEAPADLKAADFALPKAKASGCVLHHFDDFQGVQEAVRVSVTCTDTRRVMVLASQQEQLIDRAVFDVKAGRPTTVYLRSGDEALAGAQGVSRITVFDMDLKPLAERLVYRNKSRDLRVDITPDRAHYAPRDPVVLTVHTRDPSGEPVPADLSLSVVDDALLSFADDHDSGLVSHVLLQADLPEPIRKVDDLFAPGAKNGGLGIDLALGTRGWRHFDWTPVYGARERKIETERAKRLEAIELRRQPYPEYAREEATTGGAPMAYPVEDMPASAPPRPRPFHHAAPPRSHHAPPPAVVAGTGEAPVREFAQPLPGVNQGMPSPRTDFRDTVLWRPEVVTGRDGTARVKFTLSDAVTGFRAVAEGVGNGWLGRGEARIASTLPLHLDAKLPVALSTGDQVLLPVTVDNERDHAVDVALKVGVSPLLALGDAPGRVEVGAGERRTVHLPLTALPGRGAGDIDLKADASGYDDAVVRHISIEPRGFPEKWTASGTLDHPVDKTVVVPSAIDGSMTAKLSLFPSAVSEMLTGMATMVHTPGGCFEQTSSTNYPNVIVLDLLDHVPGGGGKLSVDRKKVLDTGYHILTGYQVGSGGFETWGQGPGKEALSAFGLLEFSRMNQVYHVDPSIAQQDVAYLYHQRNGQGGYDITGASAHGYGNAPPAVLDAYITWALVETGHTDLHKEIAKSAALAKTSKDPYKLALATMTMLKVDPGLGKAAAARLANLQVADGSFPGSQSSITRSENYNLLVEATALSSMALVRAGDLVKARKAVQWLFAHQTGGGVWGATQGNALAMEAIGEFVQASATQRGPAQVTVDVDGQKVASTGVRVGAHDPVELDLTKWITPGKHAVHIDLNGTPVQYSLEVGWSTETPQSDDSRRVDLRTHLADAVVGMGHTTRLTATLTNRTNAVVPDPIARIGLPAGLVAQTWQLKQLQDRGVISHYETRPREVTLYWDGIKPDEVHEVALDLVAQVPGTFTAPASSAYPYYDDQARAWVAGTKVRITP